MNTKKAETKLKPAKRKYTKRTIGDLPVPASQTDSALASELLRMALYFIEQLSKQDKAKIMLRIANLD